MFVKVISFNPYKSFHVFQDVKKVTDRGDTIVVLFKSGEEKIWDAETDHVLIVEEE